MTHSIRSLLPKEEKHGLENRAVVSEAPNKFIERVLAWRLPDKARVGGPEGDERVLEDPPGGRRGEIGRNERQPGEGRQ